MFIIGYVAATLTTVSFLAQVMKILKTGSTKDLSPVMYAVFFIGIICWLVYGIIVQDMPMILANTVTSIFAGYILYMIVVNNRKAHKSRNLK